MIIQDRDASRQVFFTVWKKHRHGLTLEPLESLILTVIQQHPEYHTMLVDEDSRDAEFEDGYREHNPFLHMGMHIAINEQISTDRPPGITAQYKIMLGKITDEHKLHHMIMGCLGECLFVAQQNRRLPDEDEYLDCLKRLQV